jgi:hypothetical protein
LIYRAGTKGVRTEFLRASIPRKADNSALFSEINPFP